MKPVVVRDENADFGPPEGWNDNTDGKCGHLSVRREEYNGRYEFISAWKPTPEELVLLNKGGVVELGCIGVQPPVRLFVELDGYAGI
jgi:hypothetical protein